MCAHKDEEVRGTFMKAKPYPKQHQLVQLFYYSDSRLLWKHKPNYRKKRKYPVLCIDGVKYFEHRLVWIYFNGDIKDGYVIDHIDRDSANNDIENLRMVTQKQNMWNKGKPKGYHLDIATNKFHVKLRVKGKQMYFGSYDTEEEAKQIAEELRLKYRIFPDSLRLLLSPSENKYIYYKGLAEQCTFPNYIMI